MIRDLNIHAQLTRRVTITGLTVTVDDDPLPLGFMAQLTLPRTPRLDADGAPRNTRPHLLRWRVPPLGPDYRLITPGSRFTLSRPGGKPYENAVYEVIEDPRIVRLGALDVGVESNLYDVANLYPLDATVTDGTGTVVGTSQVTLTSDGQYHEDTGMYENFTGYASVNDYPLFKQNTVLTVAGKRYRLTTAVIDYELLRVRFTCRLANAFS